MSVPYTFASATGSIPLSQLDANFATGITIGNSSVLLGGTITTLNNMSLANVAITSVNTQFPNGFLANSNVIVGTTTINLGSTVTTVDGLTLSNVTISSGNVTISNVTTTNVSATTANVSGTANVSNLVVIGNASVGGNVTINGNVSAANGTFTSSNVSGTANVSTLIVTGNETVNGNVTLGDASTDTVTVNGYMGVGITPSPNVGVLTRPSGLTTTTQIGVLGGVLASSAATTLVAGVYGEGRTAATAFTVSDLAALYANNTTRGAGSTITSQHGLYIADQTQATGTGANQGNFGITSLVTSGSNKWNIYASGTAQNYFAGNVGVGTTNVNYDGWGKAVSAMSATQAVFESASSRTTAGTLIGGWSAVQTNNSGASQFRVASVEAYNTGATANNTGGYLTFNTKADGTAAIAERMRIDSAGNVGIGATSSSYRLDVTGDTFLRGNLNVYSSAGGSVNSTLLTFGSAALLSAAAIYSKTDTSTAGNLILATAQSGTGVMTERARIDSNGYVGIATTLPAAVLHLAGNFTASSWTTNGINFRIAAATYTDSSTAASGTVASSGINAIARPTIAASNATVTYTDAATLYVANSPANGTNVTITNPWSIWIAAGNARFDGNLLLKGTTSALGYGTGAGGTVTQATSRTTGVTLNKGTGAITMFSAAGSTTAATFTVTNSVVAATDTIHLCQSSGTNLYVFLVTAVAAGSFNITFYTTGGTATDAPVINFSVIKGVTA